jgi:hypothetical protein
MANPYINPKKEAYRTTADAYLRSLAEAAQAFKAHGLDLPGVWPCRTDLGEFVFCWEPVKAKYFVLLPGEAQPFPLELLITKHLHLLRYIPEALLNLWVDGCEARDEASTALADASHKVAGLVEEWTR